MELLLPTEKAQDLKSLCKQMLEKAHYSLRELTSLIGRLYATAPAVATAPLYIRSLQQDDTSATEEHGIWTGNMPLTQLKGRNQVVGQQPRLDKRTPSSPGKPGYDNLLRRVIPCGMGSSR